MADDEEGNHPTNSRLAFPDVNQNDEPLSKNSPVDIDSGVDNTSESGISGDEDAKQSSLFSSRDSLDTDPPFVKNNGSIRNRNFPEQTPKEKIAVLDINAPVPNALYSTDDDAFAVDLSRLPNYYQELWLGKQESADFQVPFTKPAWFDAEKFKRGQKFAQDHLFCINYAESVSLFLLFSVKSALQPLIFTQKSGTPFKAFERYLSTLTRIMSWYQGDPWSEGTESQKHMITVRAMHRSVQQRLSAASKEELERKCSLESGPVWSTICPFVKDDFRSSCPMPPQDFCPFTCDGGLPVNQYDMAFTQFAFVGMVVTYPKRFGIHQATDEDLEGFVHLWRSLGHLLGIKEKYNYCNVDLEGVRQRTHDCLNLVMKPSLRSVTPAWEHMSRCLVKGISFYVPGFCFETSLRHVCEILNIHAPRLSKSLTLWQWFNFKLLMWTFEVFCQWPSMLRLYNRLMYSAIRRAQNFSPDTLSKWEAQKFDYMNRDPPVIKAV